ncbi:unnamed protein product [Echinostoma caproni]|uniref:Exo70 domain-containing protein n=1 Tax=Echinostoma caproni TaxID=27848 RepID=A0A183AQW6_9TREM|nr:unnamed protein product [Echinostoma caproni]
MLRLQPSAGECASSTLRRRASQFGAALASVLSPTLTHTSLRPQSTLSVTSTNTLSSETDGSLETGSICADHLTKMDAKERAALKSLWHDFNMGLNNLIRQHAGVTVPDKELREILERQLIADLVPPYRLFWDRSANLGFTSHREKYMRVSVQDLEMRLRQLLTGSGR